MPLPPSALAAHRHRIYGYALRLLRDEQEAADVTQDVLIRLWRHGDGIAPERRAAWVMRVTRNASLDALRARQSRTRYIVSHDDIDQSILSNGHSPVAATESADFRALLDRAIDDLEEPYRSIVVLREIEELPYQDIADVMDLPLNTVKVYLHRGRRRLREALTACLSAEELQP